MKKIASFVLGIAKACVLPTSSRRMTVVVNFVASVKGYVNFRTREDNFALVLLSLLLIKLLLLSFCKARLFS